MALQTVTTFPATKISFTISDQGEMEMEYFFTQDGIPEARSTPTNYLDLSSLVTLWPAWLTVITSITLPLSVMANFWVLYIGIRTVDVRNSSFYLLLLNHSLANLLLAGMNYPFFVYRMNTLSVESSISEVRLCRYWGFTVMLLVFVALLSNCIIAINRALACYPQYRFSSKIRNKRVTFLTVGLIWFTGVWLFLVPLTIDTYGFDRTFLCTPLRDLITNLMKPEMENKGLATKSYISYSFSAAVVVSLVGCCTSYAIIIRHLCMQRGENFTSARRHREKVHALIVIILVFISFITCWIPTVIGLLYDQDAVSQTPILTALPVFESLFNPFIYMFTMPVFRPKLCRRGEQVIPENLTKNTQMIPHSTVSASTTHQVASDHSCHQRGQVIHRFETPQGTLMQPRSAFVST